MKVLLCMTLIVTLCGCTRHLPGSQGHEIGVERDGEEKPDLQISMASIPKLSSKYYQGYFVSFMNNTDRWMEFAALNARFPKLGEKPTYLLGDKLRYYAESVIHTNFWDEWQWINALGSNSAQSIKKMDVIYKKPPTADEVEAILKSNRRAEFQEALPDGHLMKPFALAPGLSMSRWMVIRLPAEVDFQTMIVEIQDIHGNVKSFEVADQVFEKKAAKEAEKAKFKSR